MRLRTLLRTLALALVSATALAETITGTVTNRTTNKPAVGDDVVVLNGAEMQEVQHAKTDSSGHFKVEVTGDGFHLLRVTHDGANYFSPLRANSGPVRMDVFTASPTVGGIKLSADVMYLQSDPTGSVLSVTELLFEKNDSSPPQTLNGSRAVVFDLPAGATVEGASAKAPGGLSVQVQTQPTGQPNQYAIAFPIRPGETQIQLTYRLPYSGKMDFNPQPIITTDNMVVLLPKSMTFKPVTGTPYKKDDQNIDDPRVQVFVASNAEPLQPLGFSIAGTGQLPHDNRPQAGSPQGALGPQGVTPAGSADSNADTRPGVGLANPLDNNAERESWVSKYKWFLIGGMGLLFVVGAAVLLSGGGGSRGSAAAGNLAQPGALLEVLRHEMFAVETERLEGKLNEAQYQELKAAYDVVLRRALARQSPGEPLA